MILDWLKRKLYGDIQDDAKEALSEGFALDDNPHVSGSRESDLWEAAFIDAEEKQDE